MKVGIIGSGGREHSLCLSLKKSNKITNLYCFPGNAGTELLAQNVDIELTNFQKLRDYIAPTSNIRLVICIKNTLFK